MLLERGREEDVRTMDRGLFSEDERAGLIAGIALILLMVLSGIGIASLFIGFMW
jgi:hypothetical protein